jgi:hypothetical protein
MSPSPPLRVEFVLHTGINSFKNSKRNLKEKTILLKKILANSNNFKTSKMKLNKNTMCSKYYCYPEDISSVAVNTVTPNTPYIQ